MTFRQSCIYGTRQFGIEDQGWIAWFCVAAVTGQPFTIFGDGKQIRDTLWVGDLVDAYDRALDRIDDVSGEVFNIGGGPGNTLSLRELVALLEPGVRPRLDPPYADWRPGRPAGLRGRHPQGGAAAGLGAQGLDRRGGRASSCAGCGRTATSSQT